MMGQEAFLSPLLNHCIIVRTNKNTHKNKNKQTKRKIHMFCEVPLACTEGEKNAWTSTTRAATTCYVYEIYSKNIGMTGESRQSHPLDATYINMETKTKIS